MAVSRIARYLWASSRCCSQTSSVLVMLMLVMCGCQAFVRCNAAVQWWCVVVRPSSGVMLLYNRKKARYRKDGYCWKKRRDGKTTREDHMKLKVQGIECIYGCYVHSAILPTFHRRCYWLLQVDTDQSQTFVSQWLVAVLCTSFISSSADLASWSNCCLCVSVCHSTDVSSTMLLAASGRHWPITDLCFYVNIYGSYKLL